MPRNDVHELLKAAVSPEPRFRNHVVGQLQRNSIGQHRVVSLGDVGEGSGMNQTWLALQGLDKIGV